MRVMSSAGWRKDTCFFRLILPPQRGFVFWEFDDASDVTVCWTAGIYCIMFCSDRNVRKVWLCVPAREMKNLSQRGLVEVESIIGDTGSLACLLHVAGFFEASQMDPCLHLSHRHHFTFLTLSFQSWFFKNLITHNLLTLPALCTFAVIGNLGDNSNAYPLTKRCQLCSL